MDTTTHLTTESTEYQRSQSRTEPCTHACTHSAMHNGMESKVPSGMELPAKNGRCPRGFSALQVAIISVLKAHKQIIAYWQIAELISRRYGIATTTGAVRGALERMYRRGFLLRSRAAAGSLKGNRYAFTSEPCSHIIPYFTTQSGMDSNAQSTAQSDESPSPSILEEIDRKNTLSISFEERERTRLEALSEIDMAFFWPNLAGNGFGTHQIRQIIQRLEQKNLPLSNVLRGLDHAEWEMERGQMKDKEGKTVELPTNWVFMILAKQGYYPRPFGYISPQEQAERDAAEEQKSFVAAQEACLQVECDAWIAGLSPYERNTIQEAQNSSIRIPEKIFLRNHFRSKIWPGMQNGGVK